MATHTFEINWKNEDGTGVNHRLQGFGKDHHEAVMSKLGTDLESTSFFRKTNDDKDREVKIYEGIPKASSGKMDRKVKITAIQLTDPVEATTAKPKSTRAAATPKAPDNRKGCGYICWYQGAWAGCTRKESVEGSDRCFQHTGKVNPEGAVIGSSERTSTATPAAAPAPEPKAKKGKASKAKPAAEVEVPGTNFKKSKKPTSRKAAPKAEAVAA